MRLAPGVTALLIPILMATAANAQSTPALTHLSHVTTGFTGAPDGRGLAVTAAEEINLVMRHANLAALSSTDLDAMRTHAGHVLHLIDPAEVAEGPGLGVGVKPAVEGVVRHVGLAAAADGASEALRTHAEHIALAGEAVIRRAEAVAELARSLRAAGSAADAAPIAESLRVMALQLDTGDDANGSGRVELAGEAGMTLVEDHVYLILEAERLPRIVQ
jgi:hypothetical protein